jgi:hypothetical protein
MQDISSANKEAEIHNQEGNQLVSDSSKHIWQMQSLITLFPAVRE